MKIKPAGIYTFVLERNIPSTKAIACGGSILSTTLVVKGLPPRNPCNKIDGPNPLKADF